jgi:uncharacterized protein
MQASNLHRHGVFQWLFVALVASTALLLPGLPETQAASFNCQHAALPAEIAICGNANLSKLDEQTAGLYFLIVGSAPAATVAAVKAAQGKFLTTRNACGADIDCLVDAYTSQMMYLKNVKSDLGL